MIGVEETPPRVRWLHVATFYVIACGVSWPFFWWRDIAPESWSAWRAPPILKTASYMWGPGIAALVCFTVFRKQHRRTIRFAGSSVGRSGAFYVLPLALLALLGGPDITGLSGHAGPAIIGLLATLTVLGEEVGWRGFLQDALRPLSPARRYMLLGILWELWHFTNRTHVGPVGAAVIRVVVACVVLVALSWLIGEAVERSQSIVVALTLHLWVDLVAEAGSWQAFTALAISLCYWVWLLATWTDRPWRPWPMSAAGRGLP